MALDGGPIRVHRAAATRLGVTGDQLVEGAVRQYLRRELLDKLRVRARLSPAEAETVATQELRAYRSGRRPP